MKVLKIAFIVQSFPTVSETFIVNQITDLIDRGHQIKIFAFFELKNTIIHQKILEYDLLKKVVYVENPKKLKIKRYFEFLSFLFWNRKHVSFRKLAAMLDYRQNGRKAWNLQGYLKFRWILQEGNFDVLHAHFGFSGAYIAEMKSLGFCRTTKLITSFHGYDLSPHLLPCLKIKYHKLFQEADLLTVNTEYTKSLLRLITTKKEIQTLPVGLDTMNFKKKTFNYSPTFRLLFVGRLIKFKAPDLAIEIIKEVVKRGITEIRLIVVGDGELYLQLKDQIFKEGLQQFVEMKGAVSQEEIKNLMSMSDAFVLPGIYDDNGRAETQGLVIQEAQAMELPVIISDVGGMKYGVIDNETGFIVKEKDIYAFADKVEFLIKNKKIRYEMGRKGRRFVMENYDSKVLGNRLERLYEIY